MLNGLLFFFSMCCERWSNEAATAHADIWPDQPDVPAVLPETRSFLFALIGATFSRPALSYTFFPMIVFSSQQLAANRFGEPPEVDAWPVVVTLGTR